MADEKPKGWNLFNAVARGIAKADKAAVDKQMAKNVASLKKSKRKK